MLEGKKKINYDEYTNRPLRYQYHKLEETIEMVKEGEMPLNSYTWTHKDAKLTEEEKAKITSVKIARTWFLRANFRNKPEQAVFIFVVL